MKVKWKYAWYWSLKCSRTSQTNSCVSNTHPCCSPGWGRLQLQWQTRSWPSKTRSPRGFSQSSGWKPLTHHCVSLRWATNFKDGPQSPQFLGWSRHILKGLLSWVPYFPGRVGTFLLQRKADWSKPLSHSLTQTSYEVGAATSYLDRSSFHKPPSPNYSLTWGGRVSGNRVCTGHRTPHPSGNDERLNQSEETGFSLLGTWH